MLAFLVSATPLIADQFGDALWNYGCRLGIWVNSYNPQLPYSATGSFSPGLDPAGTDYPCPGLSNNRYGQCVLAEPGSTVTLSVVNGRFEADGVAHNYSGVPTNSSLLAELWRNGALADSQTFRWSCGGNAGCAWHARFDFATPDVTAAWSASVRRHIEGSLVSERIATCPEMAVRLGLPPTWVFSPNNVVDLMYVKAPTMNHAMYDELSGLCNTGPGPEPTPTPSPSPSPSPSPTPSPSPSPTPIPTPTPDCIPAIPLECSVVHTLAQKPAPSLLTWGTGRAANMVACDAWQEKVRQCQSANAH